MTRPIPYNGKEKYIFVSYAHKDFELVWPIIEQMQKEGYYVWYDEGIDPGTEWDMNIAYHVSESSYFIAFLSKHYLDSENCKDELNYARDKNKPRLLVYLEDVELPVGMDMRLNRLQAVFWYRYEDKSAFYKKLFNANGLDICQKIQSANSKETEANENDGTEQETVQTEETGETSEGESEQKVQGEHNRELHKFALPGFRSGKLWKKAVSVIGYALIILLGILAGSSYIIAIQSFINAVCVIVMGILCVFFWFDYRNIHDRLPLMKRKRVKIIGYILYTFIIIVIVFIVSVFLEVNCV